MKRAILLTILISFGIKMIAQQADTSISRDKAINLYLDCNSCDISYFRQNFTLINYVRDRKVADVQVIVSTMRNGGGGTEYLMQFVGLGKYSYLQDSIKFNTKADATQDEIRKQQLSALKTGLVPYILKTPFSDKVHITYENEKKSAKEKDPWNNWVFSLGANAWLNGQKTYQSTNIYTSVTASRTTEEIKHMTRASYNYSSDKYRLYNQNDSLIYSADSYSRSFYMNHSTIWSLGDHWGAGIEASFYQSTYSNLDLSFGILPAIEYNLFKYSEASQKQLRIAYTLVGSYRDYIDTTIYNKTEEYLASQQVEINFKYITSWGSIRSSVSWQNFLHDFSLYSVGTSLSTNIRIFKGLSLNIYGQLTMPRNQIGLVKTTSTPEDVLLQQHELATNYRYYTSIGLTYTFGSIYNNVVNPRLD